MTIRPRGTVSLPLVPQRGMDILPWLRDCHRSLQQLRDRVIEVPNSKRGSKSHNPFDVSLRAVPDTDPVEYQVLVQDGWINERIPGVPIYPQNATPLYKPANILWGEDGASEDPPKEATDRREFPITIGQQVSVVVYVKATSEIGPPDPQDPVDPEDPTEPAEIKIEEEDEDSLYFIPPCADDQEGAAGEFHYKMAVLRDADAAHSGPWLEHFLAGSHIDHFGVFLHENGANPAPTGSGRVLKEYDPELNQYIYRLIEQGGELTVTENEGGIEIRGNEFDGSIEISVDGGSVQSLATVVDGLITEVNPVDIPLPDAFPGGLWGTFIWENYETNNFLELTFSNGLLTAAAATGLAGAGTEASPYGAGFESDSP